MTISNDSSPDGESSIAHKGYGYRISSASLPPGSTFSKDERCPEPARLGSATTTGKKVLKMASEEVYNSANQAMSDLLNIELQHLVLLIYCFVLSNEELLDAHRMREKRAATSTQLNLLKSCPPQRPASPTVDASIANRQEHGTMDAATNAALGSTNLEAPSVMAVCPTEESSESLSSDGQRTAHHPGTSFTIDEPLENGDFNPPNKTEGSYSNQNNSTSRLHSYSDLLIIEHVDNVGTSVDQPFAKFLLTALSKALKMVLAENYQNSNTVLFIEQKYDSQMLSKLLDISLRRSELIQATENIGGEESQTVPSADASCVSKPEEALGPIPDNGAALPDAPCVTGGDEPHERHNACPLDMKPISPAAGSADNGDSTASMSDIVTGGSDNGKVLEHLPSSLSQRQTDGVYSQSASECLVVDIHSGCNGTSGILFDSGSLPINQPNDNASAVTSLHDKPNVCTRAGTVAQVSSDVVAANVVPGALPAHGQYIAACTGQIDAKTSATESPRTGQGMVEQRTAIAQRSSVDHMVDGISTGRSLLNGPNAAFCIAADNSAVGMPSTGSAGAGISGASDSGEPQEKELETSVGAGTTPSRLLEQPALVGVGASRALSELTQATGNIGRLESETVPSADASSVSKPEEALGPIPDAGAAFRDAPCVTGGDEPHERHNARPLDMKPVSPAAGSVDNGDSTASMSVSVTDEQRVAEPERPTATKVLFFSINGNDPGIVVDRCAHCGFDLSISTNSCLHCGFNQPLKFLFIDFIEYFPSGVTMRPLLNANPATSEQEYVRNLMSMPPEDRELLMRSEAERLTTYGSTLWPIRDVMSPHELAAAGFYYTGVHDRVQCAFCRGVLRNWERNDNVMNEHRAHFSYCRLVMGLDCGNIPLGQSQSTAGGMRRGQGSRASLFSVPTRPAGAASAMVDGVLTASDSGEPLPGVSVSKPKHPEYAVEARRLQTYSSWPMWALQSPENLVKAGFFYAGFGDNVKCFYCDGGLRNWEINDSPWEEHARWFSECHYLLSVKGSGFIAEVKNKYAAATSGPNQLSQVPLAVDGHARGSMDKTLTDSFAQSVSVSSFAENPAVQLAQSLGYPDELIRNALDRFFPNFSPGTFPKRAELMKAILATDNGDEHLESVQIRSGGTRPVPVLAAAQTSAPARIVAATADENRQAASSEPPPTGTAQAASVRQLPTSKLSASSENSHPVAPAAANLAQKAMYTQDVPSKPDLPPTRDAPLRPLHEIIFQGLLDISEGEPRFIEENKQMNKHLQCKVCHLRQAEIVFLPCGHFGSCVECVQATTSCPACTTLVRGAIRTYLC